MIRHIAYNIDDLNISDCLQQDSAQSMLFPGMPFDVNVLDAERQRITRLLQTKGTINSIRIFWYIKQIPPAILIW